MNRQIQAKVVAIDIRSQNTDELEGVIWTESQPAGLSNDVEKNKILIYYHPKNFPSRSFLNKILNFPVVISVKKRIIYKKDWNKKWQKSVKPVWIAKDVVIVPPFKKIKRRDKSITKIIINPAMAFGTGHHESTQGIMKMIYRHKDVIKGKKVADFGSGSGILSIFAKILGAKSVDAYDFDIECQKAIEENLRLNRINGIDFFRRSIRCVRRKYEIIFSNMLFGEIASNRDVILKSLKDNGLVFFAGILNCERSEFVMLFRDLKLIDELLINDWSSFLFKKI